MRRPPILFVCAAVVFLGFGATLTVINAAFSQAPSCDIIGHGLAAAPDNACTPGAWQTLSRAQVCAPKERLTLRAADRRKILAQYGVATWTGANGELDHRVPHFLGGLTAEDNIWPQRGAIPNLKDRLENAVRRRVCLGDPHPMRVRTAVRIFLSDWRDAYARMVEAT